MVITACTQVAPFEEDMKRANRMFEKRMYEEAIGKYGEIIKKGYSYEFPDEEAAVYVNRGNAHQLLRRYEEALRDYNRAVAIAPGSGEPYANRGILYDNLKQYDKAMADYRMALKIKKELGEPPGIMYRILYSPKNIHTIRERLEFLEGFMKAHEAGMAD